MQPLLKNALAPIASVKSVKDITLRKTAKSIAAKPALTVIRLVKDAATILAIATAEIAFYKRVILRLQNRVVSHSNTVFFCLGCESRSLSDKADVAQQYRYNTVMFLNP